MDRPFMLQSKLSFTQVGVFSMAATPYSLKLLWSPIVDSCFRSVVRVCHLHSRAL